MNFLIDNFGTQFKTTDLFLYAGIAVVVWILFKDQIITMKKSLLQLMFQKKATDTVGSENKSTTVDDFINKIFDPKNQTKSSSKPETQDNFYDLVVSWKQTRDLAFKSGCDKAVEVADQMFPFLSPSVCSKENVNE